MLGPQMRFPAVLDRSPSCSGYSTPAGGAVDSATPRRSANCGARPRQRSPAITRGSSRLPGGEYELIDYKTGRPKLATQLVDDVQLSLYAVGAREAWRLDSSQQAYYYVLDDQKVAVPDDREDRFAWIQEVALEVADGILSQGFEPTPSFAACSVCDYRLVCPAAEG